MQFEIKKIKNKLDKTKDFNYDPSIFGLENTYIGNGVSAAIIGSGLADHDAIRTSVNCEVFNDSIKSPEDNLGVSTALSGFIAAQGHTLRGVAPRTDLVFAKNMLDSGKTDFNNILASTVWAVIQEVDLILFCHPIENYEDIFIEAIQKAIKSNITILAPKTIPIPGIFEVEYTTKDNNFEVKEVGQTSFTLGLPRRELYTTLTCNKYAKVDLVYTALGLGAGLCCSIIDLLKKTNVKPTPKNVFKKLESLKRK
jgi:hypothetical protein